MQSLLKLLIRAPVVALAITAGCMKDKASEMVRPATVQEGEDVIRLKWEIAEMKTGKIIGSGEREYKADDVMITALNGDIQLEEKKLPLSDHFQLSFGASAHSSQAELVGYGLAVRRDDMHVFSWEWFNVESPTRATKLQESGEMAIEMSKTRRGWEITKTEFLTDVSLRAHRLGSGSSSSDPEWRIKIFKGSVINWPSR